MYVESVHQVLKVVYLENKQDHRLDRLFTVLLRFAKDKAFERIQKLEKGSLPITLKRLLKGTKWLRKWHSPRVCKHRDFLESAISKSTVNLHWLLRNFHVLLSVQYVMLVFICVFAHVQILICIVLYASTAIPFNFLIYKQMDILHCMWVRRMMMMNIWLLRNME